MSLSGMHGPRKSACPQAPWPRVLTEDPGRTVRAGLCYVVGLWAVFVAVDVVDLGGVGSDLLLPFWSLLLYFDLALWAQWVLLAITVVAGSYLAARLAAAGDKGLARFLGWFSAGAGLLVFASTEQVRAGLSDDASEMLGDQGLGASGTAAIDALHALAFSSISLAALLLFHTHLRRSPTGARFAIWAYGLLGVAVVGTAARHTTGATTTVGRWLEQTLIRGDLPTAPVADVSARHHLVETVIGHAVLVAGAACVLAVVLGVAADHRNGRIARPAPSEPPGTDEEPAWPRPYAIEPRSVVVFALLVVAQVALLVYLIDIVQVAGDRSAAPVWSRLYNDGPVEWTACFTLLGVVLGAGYLAGRLDALGDRGPGRFFLWLSIATAAMLLEDVGDIRHSMREAIAPGQDPDLGGIPLQTVVELPYFALIAAIPLWALVRHGHHIWALPRARAPLIGAYAMYAIAGGVSAIGRVGDLYETMGRAIDQRLLGSRLPVPEAWGSSVSAAHFNLIDGPIEESLELIGVTCFLALVLVVARIARSDSPSEVDAVTAPSS